MSNEREVTEALQRRLKEAIIKALDKSGFLVEGTAKELCPTNTGLLGASITHFVDEEALTTSVYTNVGYSTCIEYGTKPHIILPKEKKALRFEVGRKERLGKKIPPGKANIVFAKKVEHPGTKESPFIRPALDQNVENIKRIFAAEINSVK